MTSVLMDLSHKEQIIAVKLMMEVTMVTKTDWEFDHVGLVVRDLEQMSTYYASIGIGVDIGTLGPNATNPVPGSPEEEPIPWRMTTYGKASPVRQRRVPSSLDPVVVNKTFANIQMGSLVIEGIRSRPEGTGFNDDFFRQWGEGISHICFNLPDPEKETAPLLKKGCEDIMNLTNANTGKIVENYLGTAKYGALWLSFRPIPEKWHRAWQAHNQAHPLVSDWKFVGMGLATRDLDKAADYYQDLGFADLQPEAIFDSSSSPDFKVFGLTGMVAKARTMVAMVGSVAHEFAQPLEKETVFGEFLTRRGEGVYSLDFMVDDLAKEISRLTYRGVRVVLSGNDAQGRPFACFDTRKVGNLMVKLVQGV
jgi:catechol 2,3-dioxygenase-like lactoylglutathione lyase family enzyme